MVWNKFLVVLWDATYSWGGERIQKYIGHAKSSSEGFQKTFTKIESHACMYEQLARYLEIEEAFKIEIKVKISNNNKSYVQWCDLSEDKIKTR